MPAYDPNALPPGALQAQFQFGGNPYAMAAMQQALAQGQNQLGSAAGTAGTDLAKIMQILKQKQMLDALGDYNSAVNQYGYVGFGYDASGNPVPYGGG